MDKLLKWLEITIVSVAAIFAPIQSVLVTVGVLIAADMVCGILAARHRGEAITSAGLRRTISKFFIYNCALMMSFICEKYLMGSVIPATKLIGSMVGATELKSILESLDEINGASLFSSLVKTLGSKNDESKK